MLQAGALAAYSPAGELQTVPLPAGFTAMWALPQGLLLTVPRCPASAPCGACATPWCLPALRISTSGPTLCTCMHPLCQQASCQLQYLKVCAGPVAARPYALHHIPARIVGLPLQA